MPPPSLLRDALLAAIGLAIGACGGASSSPVGTTSPAGGGGTDGVGGSASSVGGQAGSTGGSGPAGASGSGGASGQAGAAGLGGGVAGASGGGAGTGGATGAGAISSCKDPKPYIVQGVDTGFVTCAQGSVHRASVTTCPSSVGLLATCKMTSPNGQCEVNADCAVKPNGYCSVTPDGPPSCACTYGCRMDTDCAANEVCLCGDPVGTCAARDDCTTDADCTGGALCLSYVPGCSPFNTGFRCQSPADTCVGGSDCSGAQVCAIKPGSSARACNQICL